MLWSHDSDTFVVRGGRAVAPCTQQFDRPFFQFIGCDRVDRGWVGEWGWMVRGGEWIEVGEWGWVSGGG